jgi:hypothetical protein
MGNETVPVHRLARLPAEELLEIRQRAVGSEREEHPDDECGGDMRPHDPRPPPREKAADEHEGDEPDVHQHHNVGSACIQHGRLRACAFASPSRVAAAQIPGAP